MRWRFAAGRWRRRCACTARAGADLGDEQPARVSSSITTPHARARRAKPCEARTGNCLSLVLMTAVFARHLNLPVRYNSVYLDET